MKNIKNETFIFNSFKNAINFLDPNHTMKLLIITNSKKIKDLFKKEFLNIIIEEENINFFWKIVGCDIFLGTYQSKLSISVTNLRGISGYYVDTNTGLLIKQSNYLSGLLSPFSQDIEDLDWTTNEKLRSCVNNFKELQKILEFFIL